MHEVLTEQALSVKMFDLIRKFEIEKNNMLWSVLTKENWPENFFQFHLDLRCDMDCLIRISIREME